MPGRDEQYIMDIETVVRQKDEVIERLLAMVTQLKRENLDLAEKLAAAERRIAVLTR